jgi:hypothetical protein
MYKKSRFHLLPISIPALLAVFLMIIDQTSPVGYDGSFYTMAVSIFLLLIVVFWLMFASHKQQALLDLIYQSDQREIARGVLLALVRQAGDLISTIDHLQSLQRYRRVQKKYILIGEIEKRKFEQSRNRFWFCVKVGLDLLRDLKKDDKPIILPTDADSINSLDVIGFLDQHDWGPCPVDSENRRVKPYSKELGY